MYEAGVEGGRPSIAPEKLMRAMLLHGKRRLRALYRPAALMSTIAR